MSDDKFNSVEEELEFLRMRHRQDEDDLKTHHEQIRILREKVEHVEAERDSLKEELASRDRDESAMEIRMNLSMAAAWVATVLVIGFAVFFSLR